MIKERIALYNEVWTKTNNEALRGLSDLGQIAQLATAIFQEVCKDDRMAKIHAEKMKIPRTGFQFINPEAEPATEKQIDYMKKLKIWDSASEHFLTKAEASRLIDEKVKEKQK